MKDLIIRYFSLLCELILVFCELTNILKYESLASFRVVAKGRLIELATLIACQFMSTITINQGTFVYKSTANSLWLKNMYCNW